MSSVIITEIVIYVVHESSLESLARASAAMDTFLSKRTGFIRRIVQKDMKVSNRFIDIVEWSSLEDAEKSAQAAEKKSLLKQLKMKKAPFMQAIASIDIMSHFTKQ